MRRRVCVPRSLQAIGLAAALSIVSDAAAQQRGQHSHELALVSPVKKINLGLVNAFAFSPDGSRFVLPDSNGALHTYRIKPKAADEDEPLSKDETLRVECFCRPTMARRFV